VTPERVVVVRRSEVPDGGATVVNTAGDLAVAVFRVGEAFYAIDNRCPHKGGPLAEGPLDGTVVTCPWHGFTVDVRTGICPRSPWLRVRTFSVDLAGDELRITVAP
jgi:nitrite reductase/ring-hydroxylating ferredoxin subunit